mmetsp:Transcript_42878/g.106720  ORF Transcript_42878/g.106720 Transcript_42878/m.106720 type:complete len:272 (+) Transcript_42878:365-1180(+)
MPSTTALRNNSYASACAPRDEYSVGEGASGSRGPRPTRREDLRAHAGKEAEAAQGEEEGGGRVEPPETLRIAQPAEDRPYCGAEAARRLVDADCDAGRAGRTLLGEHDGRREAHVPSGCDEDVRGGDEDGGDDWRRVLREELDDRRAEGGERVGVQADDEGVDGAEPLDDAVGEEERQKDVADPGERLQPADGGRLEREAAAAAGDHWRGEPDGEDIGEADVCHREEEAGNLDGPEDHLALRLLERRAPLVDGGHRRAAEVGAGSQRGGVG